MVSESSNLPVDARPPSERAALGGSGSDGDGRGRFSRPQARPIEAAAAGTEGHARGPWRAPVAAAVLGYLAAAVGLVALGWLVVHTPLGSPVRDLDLDLARRLAGDRSAGWNDYSDAGTSSADTLPIVVGGVVVTLVLCAIRRWRDVVFLPLALGLELSLFLTVNYLVGRGRPSVDQLGAEPTTHSFPSGHVAATVVLYGGILLLLGVDRWRRPAKVLGWAVVAAIAGSVAFSRVYRGMHYLSDVVAGALLGIAALLVAMAATRASVLGSTRRREAPR